MKESRCRQPRAIDKAEGPASGTAALSHLQFGAKMRPGVVWASLGMVPKHSNLYWHSCSNDRAVQSAANVVELENLMGGAIQGDLRVQRAGRAHASE
jgi:hypothetical protein